jgi:hypothetical protein
MLDVLFSSVRKDDDVIQIHAHKVGVSKSFCNDRLVDAGGRGQAHGEDPPVV